MDKVPMTAAGEKTLRVEVDRLKLPLPGPKVIFVKTPNISMPKRSKALLRVESQILRVS